MALVALLFSTAGPLLAGEKKYDFIGTRDRTFAHSGYNSFDNCWIFRVKELTYWTVTIDPSPVNHLLREFLKLLITKQDAHRSNLLGVFTVGGVYFPGISAQIAARFIDVNQYVNTRPRPLPCAFLLLRDYRQNNTGFAATLYYGVLSR